MKHLKAVAVKYLKCFAFKVFVGGVGSKEERDGDNDNDDDDDTDDDNDDDVSSE